MIRKTLETILQNAAKHATKGMSIPIYRALENIVKQQVSSSAVDSLITSRPDRLTKSQEFVRNNVGCHVKTTSFKTRITKVVKSHAKIAVMNETKFYERSTNVGREKKEATPPSPLTGRSTASSVSIKYDENEKYDKKKNASFSLCS